MGAGVAAGRVVVMGPDVGTPAGQKKPLFVKVDSSKPKSRLRRPVKEKPNGSPTRREDLVRASFLHSVCTAYTLDPRSDAVCACSTLLSQPTATRR